MDSPSALLHRRGLKPKPSWGQNFLSSEQAVQRIVGALAPVMNEWVVELGAGLGHLTRALSAAGARVVAVERDRDLVQVLEDSKMERVRVLAANAAKLTFAHAAGVQSVALVGNLPFHLTSPILFQILEQHRSISRAVLTIQKEVAIRLCAQPGSRDYGVLSVLLGLHFDIESLFVLPSELFYPSPKVDSAVVRLTPLEQPRARVSSDEGFRRVVKAGFAQRRKTLINSLKSGHLTASMEELRAALERAGIDATRRAETLSIEEFAAVERVLSQPG